MHAYRQSLLIVAAGAAAYIVWIFVSRNISRAPERPRPAAVYRDVLGIDHLTNVTILHFYASPGILVDGDKAVLCYGVAKAKAVRLEPPIEAISPSLNRCVQAAPEQSTQYTLFAEGEDGKAVSESLEIQVIPDPLRAPKVLFFNAARKDNVYSLCFGTENGVRVSVDPPVIPAMEGAPRGCFYVAPKQTTTYTLAVSGSQGTVAKRQVTLRAP